MTRLETIQNMYGWAGFVYALDACKSRSDMAAVFAAMKAKGARSIITFDYCDNAAFGRDLLNAVNDSDIYIFPQHYSYENNFKNAGLDIPVSISELAYGWQQAGDFSAVQNALDLFMINNFPYFAQNAEEGGSSSTWSKFINDMNYYVSIANGKPLVVTQTVWPSNEDEFAPNSPNIVVNAQSGQDNWNLWMVIVPIFSNPTTSCGCGEIGMIKW
ncbi:hypothetical protein BZG36_04311 [Bifiguratus adelaidae]|uniref:Glycoside hydrolase family 17 protein n=1 Tax=Bifiguratus adelaidae TaxID=1938954 RepID=A0A261XZQ4_9FUNG|nr:hypothetical protein BZG36_04311 [Bifiguratus adelaidae]